MTNGAHKVEIVVNRRGVGTVHIDGQEVPNVVRVAFDARPMREPEVELTLLGMEIEVRAETGEIVFKRERGI